MIQIIPVADNVAAFRALEKISSDDYRHVLIPEVTKLLHKIDEINLLLVIDTEIQNLTADWMEDALMGLKNLGRWNRTAIVTDSNKLIAFTNSLSYIIPGIFRGFTKEQYDQALYWVETGKK